MSYFQTLGLKKEPFTTSPDPSFFYRSQTHLTALYQLEIAIRLKRGLSLIFGDVGTGKTTLSRTLLNNFKMEEEFEFHLIFDPSFQSEFQFVSHLAYLMKVNPRRKRLVDYKSSIQDFLFEKHFTDNKTIVLIIDECQKMSISTLEILRVLLNYETNENKLLQLILFSQLELIPKILKTPNFTDRIYFKHILKPLEANEAKEMIKFRLFQAGWDPNKILFTEEALNRVIEYSGGLLRKINQICHKALLKMIMYEASCVDQCLIDDVVEEEEVLIHA